MTSILWLRRDLRRTDHPALLAAAAEGPVLPVVVVDPRLWGGAGVRRAWYAASVRACRDSYDGRLTVLAGDPEAVLPVLAERVGAGAVHVTRETTPYGRRRDARVSLALRQGGVRFVETGTPYAVGPGLVLKRDGTPYQVFTPFHGAWRDHGWPVRAPRPDALTLLAVESDPQAEELLAQAAAAPVTPQLPAAGEAAAMERWQEFLQADLHSYASDRDRPDRTGTTRLSPWLKVGALHPRTLLTDLARYRGPGAEALTRELAWREFYADVLWHNPSSAHMDLRPALRGLPYDEPHDAVDAWRSGHTGYPIVDAGMRQLLATGWMHNRVRMITASFLTKDLHVRWQVGARHFLDHLIDGDLASNAHGWQWVAGTGTDASPYFRVFNPVSQGRRFDPEGTYVRRWVPELAHLPGALAHEPWRAPDGFESGYPQRIVDHAQERAEALARWSALTR